MRVEKEQEMLEDRGELQRAGPGSVAQPQEAWPSVILHCEEATTYELENKARVSMNMEGASGPWCECQDDSCNLSYIVRQRDTGEGDGGQNLEGGDPCHASQTGL